MSSSHFTSEHQDILASIMQARRDVRGNKFLAQKIPEETLDKILQAASWAPSVGYSQPWEFVIVEHQSTRKKIVESFQLENQKAKAQFCDDKQALYARLKLEGILEAPTNIAVFYRPSHEPVLGQTSMKETGIYSVVCAIQNMWLMARALNIGLGWVSILSADVVKRQLNAPDELEFVAYLCLGYTKDFLEKPELELIGWEKAKPISSKIIRNHF